MSLATGSRLGPYEILSALGSGGMGEVYRARDTKLNRDVALKVLPDSFATDPDRLARFQREAQVLASLNHPNIAHIHGIEESNGVRALVMELVEGEDLAQRLTRGAIPIEEALPIAKQIAEALEAAHEQGIIHRDLKPANIKVREDGTVKVLDFGLAKTFDPPASSPNVSQSPTITTPAMTQAGVILGTAAYMSPEQARGRPVDKRTDVWAFGCVLFEMLTGQRSFEGELISDVLAAVLKTEPNWLALPTGTPPTLRRLVGRCLEKDMRRRLQAIGEARVQIEDLLLIGVPEPVTGPAAPVGTRLWPRVVIIGVPAVVIGAAVAVTATWLATRPAVARLTRTNIAAVGSAALTINGLSRDLVISPDGSRVIYVGNNGTQLFVRALDALEPVAIATGQIREPFVSPDGQWVGFVEGVSDLKKVAISGGPPIHLATLDGAPEGLTWLPDDTIVFGTNNQSTGLQRVSANGGTPMVITRPDHPRGDVDHLWPEVLPGGRVVLYTITQISGPDSASIAAIDLRTQTSTIVVRGGVDAHYVASGHLVYVAAGTLRAVRFDLGRLAVRGPAVPVVPRLVTMIPGAGDFGIASDGTLVYVDVTPGSRSARARTLVWVDRTGKEELIAAPRRAYQAVSLSPDGQQVALAITDEENDIWVWDLRRSTTLRRLTFDPGVDTFPIWTPDGHRIVFSSQSGGPVNVWWKMADGTGMAERLTTSANILRSSSVSSDGKQVVLTEQTPTKRSLMLLALDGTHSVTPLLQTPFDDLNGTVSPDGHWLAYDTNSSGRFEVWVRPFPSTSAGQYQISMAGGTHPIWAHSGKELFFLGANGALMRVPVAPTATTWNAEAPTKLLEPGYYTGFGNPNRSYDVSPDGKRFLMIKSASDDATTVAPSIILIQRFDELLKRTLPTK